MEQIQQPDKDIYKLAEDWLALDKNSDTRARIEGLVQEKNEKELEALLRVPITFGTAGLRARMEAGFSRMNDLTVIQASQGFCQYVLETVPGAAEKGVVIGYDHRHNSERFAKLTAAAFVTKNFKVYLYKKLVHTPMVPFGIKSLGAACGVMITASHNPKEDNGYKVYWENGCQIVEPHDAGISRHITANRVPWTWDVALCDTASVSDPYERLTEDYFQRASSLVASDYLNSLPSDRLPKFVYTPMHGVGGPVAMRAFKAVNYPEDKLYPVPQQFDSNPEFPTVKFPNPEEKGALDLAIAHAEEVGASLVLANDPDADRFAAAEKLPSGKWQPFTGNQIGTLLAYQVWTKNKHRGSNLGMLASAVSSKMLQSMGKVEGFHFEETLTGFKWLGNRAIQLKDEKNIEIIFAYEEAIGFMAEDIVKDKDGVTAMLIFAELAVQLQAKNITVLQHLYNLYQKYGIFVESNSYYLSHNPKVTAELFDKIRYGQTQESGDSRSLAYPQTIGAYRVTGVRDLTVGYDSASSLPNHQPVLPVSASSQMITFQLADERGYQLTLTLRTSGTEPKIKYYSELSCLTPESTDIEGQLQTLRQVLHDAVHTVLDKLLNPTQHNLVAA